MLFKLSTDQSRQKQGFSIRYLVILPEACPTTATTLDYTISPLESSLTGWLSSDRYRRGFSGEQYAENSIPTSLLENPQTALMSYPPNCNYR
jgi:hypothetical protein